MLAILSSLLVIISYLSNQTVNAKVGSNTLSQIPITSTTNSSYPAPDNNMNIYSDYPPPIIYGKPPTSTPIILHYTGEELNIYNVLVQKTNVEVNASYTLDPSHLIEVYINDKRGGLLDDDSVKLVSFIRQDNNISAEDIGLLDFRLAYYSWRKISFDKITAINQKMHNENRASMTAAEVASLTDPTGRLEIFGRGPDPATIPLESFKFTINSFDINGDVAKVQVTYPDKDENVILVKNGSKWYIAGIEIIKIHF